jgi:hypothetical protein
MHNLLFEGCHLPCSQLQSSCLSQLLLLLLIRPQVQYLDGEQEWLALRNIVLLLTQPLLLLLLLLRCYMFRFWLCSQVQYADGEQEWLALRSDCCC